MGRDSLPPLRNHPHRPRNRLLASLPEADFQRLAPDLKTVPAHARQVVQRQGHVLEHVYFPNGGVVSVVVLLANGSMAEVATIGDEGFAGIEALFGADVVAQGETMLQVPDTDMEMVSVAAFRREVARGEALQDLVGRYAQVSIAQLMYSGVCHALHHVHERCCRRLLETQDRTHTDDFHLSHEFLAVTLGVRRQTVTVVAGALQEAGFIRYTHGHVRVLNRPALESASCECYAALRRQADRLFQ